MQNENVPIERPASADAGQEWVRAAERLPERLAARQGARLYSAIAMLFLLALLFRFFDVVSRVALIGFVGAILALAFHSIVVRVPLRRGLATVVVAVSTVGVIGLGVWQGFAALLPQLRSLALDLPQVEAKIEGWQAQLRQQTGLEVDLLGAPLEKLLQDPAALGMTLLTQAFGVLEILGIVILVLAGSIYVVAQPNEQLLDPVLRTIPRERQPAFRRMMHLIAHRLGGWIRGTLLSMVIIGTLSGIAFWVLGAPYPLLLGVFAGMFELIPIVGPWIGGALAVLVTLFYEPQTALYVGIAVLVIQQVEGNFVYPFVMSGAASIHPFVTLLSLLLFGAIFGVLGALLALPLTLAIGTAVEVLWVEERLGNRRAPDEPLVET
ncbi:MAG: AI-2E family transporter [Gemmatimonadetes bacterium]|nr:AI-2E family transporter [Gemmatimonadota bacterium]